MYTSVGGGKRWQKQKGFISEEPVRQPRKVSEEGKGGKKFDYSDLVTQ